MGVQSLCREDPLEEGTTTLPVFLSGESHGQGSLVGYGSQGHKELDTTETTQHTHMPVEDTFQSEGLDKRTEGQVGEGGTMEGRM